MKTKRSHATAGKRPRTNTHLRELDSRPFKETQVPEKFRDFVVAELFDHVPFTGRKIPRKKEIAVQILNNLVLAGLCDCTVGDTRDHHLHEARLRIAIWDAITNAGLTVKCLGSQIAKVRTRYLATPELLRLFKGWHIADLQGLDLGRNTELDVPTTHALVVLRKGKKDPVTGKRIPKAEQNEPIPLPDDPTRVQQRLCEFEDWIEQVNRANLKYTWVEFGQSAITGRSIVRPVNPCLRMIYRGCLWNGGRLYTFGPASGQSIPEDRRRTILIGDEPVAEFDFSAHAIRMLYHYFACINPDPAQDLYRPEVVLPRFYRSPHATDETRAVARAFVKQVTNTCLNVSHKMRAQKSAEKAFADADDFPVLQKIIQKVERTTPSKIVDRVSQAHPDVNRHFFSNVGTKLTRLEVGLMLKILLRFAESGKPVLGIHDGLLVRRRDAKFARRIMRRLYKNEFGFSPVVKRDF